MPPPRVLLLGWAGADWRLIQPLLDSGRMPHLARLLDEGCAGRLVSVAPGHPAAMWASIATGQSPDVHGVLGWTLPDPSADMGVRLLGSHDWQAPPLWEQVRSQGLATCVVGVPTTHPAAQPTVPPAPQSDDRGAHAAGVLVSDAWALAEGSDFDAWPARPHAVAPAALADELAALRVHPADITGAQVLGLVPQAARIDQETDARLTDLVTWLAQAATVHSTATHLLASQPWQLSVVHFDLLERVSSRFLACRPPRMAHVSGHDEAVYGEVVDNVCTFMDMLLGRYLTLVGDDPSMPTTVMVVSDHGFHGGALRPGHPVEGLQPSSGYRPQGLLVAAGPGVARDRLVFGADLLDIAPTVLRLLGLQVPAGLPGHALRQLMTGDAGMPDVAGDGAGVSTALAAMPDPATVALHEAPLPTSPETWADAAWTRQRLRELVGIGLLRPLSPDPEVAAHDAQCLLLDHRVQSCMARGRSQDARRWLAQLSALAPDRPETLLATGQCALALGDADGCRAAIRAMEDAGLHLPALDALKARLCLHERQPAMALELLQRAEAASLGGARLAEPIGQVHLLLRQWNEAQHSFAAALDRDPDDVRALAGMGQALAAAGDPEAALPWLMRSLSRQQLQASTHLLLGRCLAALGRLDEAQQALSRALAQQPGLAAAQDALREVQRRGVARAIATAANRRD